LRAALAALLGRHDAINDETTMRRAWTRPVSMQQILALLQERVVIAERNAGMGLDAGRRRWRNT
jgi:hypothetical protein